MNGVPGMRLSPSGPDLSLFAPLQVGPVSQPKNPPVICLRNVLVLMSMTSTDLLLRSVKYMRPFTESTAEMSKEKFVPAVTLGTAINAFRLTPLLLLLLEPPPPHPASSSAAAIAAANA